MNTILWIEAARLWRLAKTKKRFVTPENERKAYQAAWELEDWLISEEGQAALELLEASEKRIVLKTGSYSDEGFWSTYLSSEGFICNSNPTRVSGAILHATSYQISSVLFEEDPRKVLPFIKNKIGEIAREVREAKGGEDSAKGENS